MTQHMRSTNSIFPAIYRVKIGSVASLFMEMSGWTIDKRISIISKLQRSKGKLIVSKRVSVALLIGVAILFSACGGHVGRGSTDSSPSGFTVFNGALYFSADDGTGRGLWKTDGTDAGTVRVKDIRVFSEFTVFNGALYFSVDDGTSGFELWKSDGTGAGTVRVKDIDPSGGEFTVFNGALYFGADDGTSGFELWKSDGTGAGTVRVKDINPGAGYSYPFMFTVFNGALYFSADDGTSSIELWKTNGTDAGTVRVKDINPGVVL